MYFLGRKRGVGPHSAAPSAPSALLDTLFIRAMPPRQVAGDVAASTAAVLAALQRQEQLLVALAKAQVAGLDDTPRSDVVALAEQLEGLAQCLVNTREEADAEDAVEEGSEEGGEEEEGEEEEEEEEDGGEDGGGVSAKVDEIKELLQQSQHEDFCNIARTGKCGVCIARADGIQRNGSYGCFGKCNVRICWHPDCLRDHLALNRGNKAVGTMVRHKRAPASGEVKHHFPKQAEPAPAPAPARKRKRRRS